MERQVQDWLGEAGVVPPGNGVEAHLWEGEEQGQSEAELVAKMSPTERAAYETKRLKLRKAMVSLGWGGGCSCLWGGVVVFGGGGGASREGDTTTTTTTP
jgi:hypothetical protein